MSHKNNTKLPLTVYAALTAIAVVTSGCGTILPPVPDFKVVDLKAQPDELRMGPSIDPIDRGSVQAFKPEPFVPLEISVPKADRTFGLTYSEDKGDWAHTQNTSQLKVNGKRVVDPQGEITQWSPLSDTGFITYLVRNDRVEKTPDLFTHYDLKLLDARTGKPPQKIASYATNGLRQQWRFGREPDPVQAELFHLTSKGVVLLRDDSTVITYFEAGKPPKTTALPVGYKAVSFGVVTDLAYGKHIRIVQHRGPHKLLGLLPSAQEELYDISFWNMERGVMTATAKDVVINVTSEESYQNYVNGAAQMVNSSSGPIVITIEDTLKKTIARNLATLEKVTLVETSMKQGHGFETNFERRRAGGVGLYHKVWVRFTIANGDMSNSQINDLEKWMKDKAATLAQVEQ